MDVQGPLTKVQSAVAVAAAIACGTFANASEIAVSNVSMRQDRATQKVHVTYDLANEGDAPAYVILDIQTNGVSIGRDNLKSLSGDFSDNDFSATVSVGTGKEIVWDARKDWKGNLSTVAAALMASSDWYFPRICSKKAFFAGETRKSCAIITPVMISNGNSLSTERPMQ